MKLEDNISAPLEDASTPIGKDVVDKHRLDRIAGETLKLPYSFNDIKLIPIVISYFSNDTSILSKLLPVPTIKHLLFLYKLYFTFILSL